MNEDPKIVVNSDGEIIGISIDSEDLVLGTEVPEYDIPDLIEKTEEE
jgi:uncharacterized protein YuzE